VNIKSVFDEHALEYDSWYDDNREIYQSELLALRQVVPIGKNGLEVGAGTARFASLLGVEVGVDPSEAMASIAAGQGVKVKKGVAENLPFDDESFDFVMFITAICFLDNVFQAFKEANRVLNDRGEIIIGMIDKDSDLGRKYEKMKVSDKFYKDAHFHGVEEIVDLLKRANFRDFTFYQTLIRSEVKKVEKPQTGYGKGGFVVIKAIKMERIE
jgi:ubiquinone/menaquinone biosynthesis C-methylase UbiE